MAIDYATASTFAKTRTEALRCAIEYHANHPVSVHVLLETARVFEQYLTGQDLPE